MSTWQETKRDFIIFVLMLLGGYSTLVIGLMYDIFLLVLIAAIMGLFDFIWVLKR
ncbi:MAG: hypothetical protein KAQ99_03920 [Candidatus Aureabacteria bacterium]|nr:hypothetical protein [Candidatus Auribacterota bacterium]